MFTSLLRLFNHNHSTGINTILLTWTYDFMFVVYRVILLLYSLGTRYEIADTAHCWDVQSACFTHFDQQGVCVQMKPMMKPHEINPFANQLAGKLQSFIRLHLANTTDKIVYSVHFIPVTKVQWTGVLLLLLKSGFPCLVLLKSPW